MKSDIQRYAGERNEKPHPAGAWVKHLDHSLRERDLQEEIEAEKKSRKELEARIDYLIDQFDNTRLTWEGKEAARLVRAVTGRG